MLKSGEKIYEHRKKFCDEEVRVFLYLGKPRQQIVAELCLGKRESLLSWREKYMDDLEVRTRIDDFLCRNKYAMPVLWFKEIDPIDFSKLKSMFPEIHIPISFHFLDKKKRVLKWLDEEKRYTGYSYVNDFSTVEKNDICRL